MTPGINRNSLTALSSWRLLLSDLGLVDARIQLPPLVGALGPFISQGLKLVHGEQTVNERRHGIVGDIYSLVVMCKSEQNPRDARRRMWETADGPKE